ncbi:MAG: glycosyltransferase [Pirellulaceae bacterium]
MRTSIVIAAHNEGTALWRTVRAVEESIGKLDYEIVVADDASDDGSIDEAMKRFPHLRVSRVDERQGASPTKDRGARQARGEVLVFLDGHCNPERGAIERLVHDVELTAGEALVTPTIPSLDEPNWKNRTCQVGHGYRLDLDTFDCGWLPLARLRGVRRGGRNFHQSPAAIGCSFAIHRRLYEELHGFDPHMRYWGLEDLDLSLKCWLMSHEILHDAEARIGHRFQQRFDRYDVPMQHLVVNKLRMARKNFSESVFGEWVERCRAAHGGELAEHPEGVWACAWKLFESGRASVEAERAALLSRRSRDEFWYADRFGLEWPKVGSTTETSPGTSVTALQIEPTPEPSPSPRRTILLLGYWPPTDIGIDGRHGMLWNWKEKKAVTLEGKTYDVVAFSPRFPVAPLGTYPWPAPVDDYWGKGTGEDGLTVDYRDTSTKFWAMVKEHRPIAIMSFSRWKRNREWALDAWGTNWARDQAVPNLAMNKFWSLYIGDYVAGGERKPGAVWEKPFIGGSATDPSPLKGEGAIKYNPADRSKAALSKRNSNLPMTEIITAIDAEFDDDEVKPFKNDQEGPGNFVSNFLAYHVAWYREWWQAENDDADLACLRSGHTHVGGLVTVPNAEKAVEIQLKELFKVLPATD